MSTNSDRLQEPALRYARHDFPVIRNNLTVGEALSIIRRDGVGERIIYFYVVNHEGQLVGIVPTRRLLISPSTRPVADLMITEVLTISDRATVHSACEMFVRHKLFAFPIVDELKRVRGVIDIGFFSAESISVVEHTKIKDIFELIGFGLTQLQGRSFFGVVRYRLPSLLVVLVAGVVCAAVARAYGATLSQNIILVFFSMLILGVSESVGTQSITLTLQNLHLGRPSWGNYWDALKREALTTFILGVVCGLIAGAVSLFWQTGPAMAITIGTSTVFAVLAAGVIGVTISTLVAGYSRIAAGPIAHGAISIAALLIYLNAARIFLAH